MSSVPSHMTAVLLTAHGGLDALMASSETPVPEVGDREVLVRVRAAAINNIDINTRIGWYSKGSSDADDGAWNGVPLTLPRIQGADVCGEIVAVGRDVSTERIGQRVIIEPVLREVAGETLARAHYFGSECDGGFAQFTKVASVHAHHINAKLSDEELASFPCSYSTAENMLTRAGLSRGETVLITGASGGVGSAAIQLAKARGAHVIAVVSAGKAALIRALGADVTLDRDECLLRALGTNAVDVVVDLVGGDQWSKLPDVLKPYGRYAVAGAIAGAVVTMDLRTLYLKDQSFFGCTIVDEGVFARVIRLIEEGDVKPVVAAIYPLADIAKAQEAFISKAHVGKLVLRIP